MPERNMKNKIQAALIAAFLVNTIFIFGPIEAYINNQDEFWFGLTALLGLIVGGTTIGFLLVYVFLISTKSKKYNRYVEALILGLTIALYIQGNFMLVKYGVLDGRSIEWDNYGNWGIYNTIIWIIVIATSLIIAHKLPTFFYKFSCGLAAFFTTIQVVTLLILLFSVGLGAKDNYTVITEGAFDASRNKNVAVFIVDTMDAQYFQSVMEEYPEITDIFTDFTYYENTMGLYPTTKAALPYILTGSKYLNETPYNEYINDAWEKSPLIKELNNNNFSCGIYTSSIFLSPKAKLINVDPHKPIVKSGGGLYKEYGKFVLFKYMPHLLKKHFVINTADFEKYRGSRKSTLYYWDTQFVYKLLLKDGINATSQNTFRVYHYEGAHPPYTLDENLNEAGMEETSAIQQTRGSLKIVEDYINLLKEKGCYENSMIIVMADHGGEGALWQHPALLIKSPQQNHPFYISDASISYVNLMATYISGIADNYRQYGESIEDIDNKGLADRTREYLFYAWDDSWDKEYLPDIKQYLTSKSVNELGGEDFTNVIFTDKGKTTYEFVKYKWDQKFSFLDEEDRKSVLEGISLVQDNYSWSLGNRTIIRMNLLNEPKNDVLLTLNIPYILGDTQRIRIFINDIFIAERTLLMGDESLKIVVPRNDLVKGINNIRFEYPDAKIPKEVIANSTDTRLLAVCLDSLKLSEQDIEKFRLKVIDESEIDFGKNGNSSLLFLDKWSTQEDSGIWTTDDSKITFYTDKEIVMDVTCIRLTDSVETQILLNGEIIGTLNDGSIGSYKILLPKEKLRDDGKQIVTFSTPEAKTPKELGINDDIRTLGIFVTKISFKVQ